MPSSYKTDFDNHPFHQQWQELMAAIEQIETIHKESDSDTSNEQKARLIKVSRHIDEIIKGIDPEVMPSSLHILQSMNKLAKECTDSINQFTPEDQSPAYIDAANKAMDSLINNANPIIFFAVFQKSIASIAENAQQHLSSLESYAGSVFGTESEDGLKQNLENLEREYDSLADKAKSSIEEDKGNLADMVKEAKEHLSSLESFSNEALGEKDESGEYSGGIKQRLEQLQSDLEEFQKGQKTKYAELITQIESLLPGATSAGLGHAYAEMKVSFNEPIKNASWQFYGAISMLVFVSFFSFIDDFALFPPSISFVKAEDWSDIVKNFIGKSPIYIPVIWFAYYATKRRSEVNRLQQEYAHKEAVAKSYDGYKQQIENLGEESKGLLKDLIEQAIVTIGYNPSVTLEKKHGDEPPIKRAADSVAGRN